MPRNLSPPLATMALMPMQLTIPAFHPAADESGEYKVEDILDHRSHGHGHSLCMEYLVKWRGYSVFELMWEPEANLTNCAHTLALY